MTCRKGNTQIESLAYWKYRCFNTYKKKLTKLKIHGLVILHINKMYQAWKKLIAWAIGAFKFVFHWWLLYEKQFIKLHLNFAVILPIVLPTTKSKLKNVYRLRDGWRGKDRVTLLFRDWRLQNHQELPAPWSAFAHARTIHNTMHFSKVLFLFWQD